jgi:multiple sugar transport system substrate-binding protein
MSSHRSVLRLTRRSLMGAAMAGALVLGAAGSAQAEKVKLTVWSWVADLAPVAKAFEAAHPDISVELLSVGNGPAHYMKMRNALKAGSGAPDIVQVEFFMLRSFRQADALLDIGPLGGAALKDEYADWAWAQVTDGGKVIALPWDGGPMGLIYREDVLAANGIAVPATWDDFYNASKTLKEKGQGALLTNTSFSDGGWVAAMLWQAGWKPFVIDGRSIKVSIKDDAAKKFAAYWQKMADEKLIGTTGEFTPEWYSQLDSGKTAAWISAAWGPMFMASVVPNSAGRWRAAAMPSWEAGKPVAANWGGSTLAVMAGTAHPKEAALFVIWALGPEGAAEMQKATPYLFPVRKAALNDARFENAEVDFFGKQKVNAVFAESSKNVDTSFEWSPFQDFLHAQLGAEFAAAATGTQSFDAALDKIQTQVEEFVVSQGFELQK